MTRWLLIAALLAGLVGTVSQGAEQPATSTPEVGKASHVHKAKSFALTALDGRIHILEVEKICVIAAQDTKALRNCSITAKVARKNFQTKLAPAFDALRARQQP